MISEVDVVLFAGGYAGSLRPITEFMPKALLPLGDRPLISRIIDQLMCNLSINRIFVVANHFPELLLHYIDLIVSAKAVSKRPTIIDVAPEPWGTGGMLSKLKGKTGDDILLYYCDVLPIDFDYQSFLRMHVQGRQSKVVGTLAVSRRYKLETGYIDADSDGIVTRFIEKPETDEKIKNMAISLFTSEIFNFITTHEQQLYADVVNALIGGGAKLQCYFHEREWHHFQHINKYHMEHVTNYEKWIR